MQEREPIFSGKINAVRQFITTEGAFEGFYEGSYGDALYEAIAHTGWFPWSPVMLRGMTALCFRFSLHRRLEGHAATVYNWMAEHNIACDLIGITTAQCAGYSFRPTFALYQKQAIADIRASLERGQSAVVWHDGFITLQAYLEEEQCFTYVNPVGGQKGCLPASSFGKGESPYWYYQLYETYVEKDWLEVVKESCIQAVYHWEQHDPMLPEADYACGQQVYTAASAALQQAAGIDWHGAATTFAAYAREKQFAADYISEAANLWPALQSAKPDYERLAELFAAISGLFAQMAANSNRPDSQEPANQGDEGRLSQQICLLLAEACEHEAAGVKTLRALLAESIDNRFSNPGLR